MPKERSLANSAVEIAALTALAATFAIVIGEWAKLPAQIPIHFGMSGRPNGWAGKSALWFLLLIDAASYMALTAASKYQQFINIPLRVNRDAPEVRQILSSMVTVLKVILMLLFLYLIWGSVQVAIGRASRLGPGVLGVFLLAVFATLAIYMARLWPYRK